MDYIEILKNKITELENEIIFKDVKIKALKEDYRKAMEDIYTLEQELGACNNKKIEYKEFYRGSVNDVI